MRPGVRQEWLVSTVLRLLACAAATHGASAVSARDESPAPSEPGEHGEQAAPGAQFDLWEIRVVGSSVLPNRDIESVVYPFLGPGKTIADVESARAALEELLHERGYGTVFVDIPEQQVDEGLVRLQVTEGKLNSVRLRGARYFSNRALRAELPAATSGTVPHLPTVQREITAVNVQTADRTVTPVLKAGPVPGTVDLELKVKDRLPVHASLELNNAYTADTTELRAVAAVSYDNMFGRLDSFSLQYQTSPLDTSEVGVLAASYVARLRDSDARLAAFYVSSDTDVATVGALGVLGKGTVAGLRYVNPLNPGRLASQTLTLGVDYKDFTEDILLEDDPSLTTPISYVNWSAAYGASWRDGDRALTAEVTANFGLRGDGNDEDEFANKRYRARPNYFYVRGDASFLSPLSAGLALRLGLSGQVAVEPIIANEQYPIGGVMGVRGYLEAEALGDVGLKTTVQLESRRWTAFDDRFSLGAYGFVDYGFVGTLQPLPDEAGGTDLAGIGVGLDLRAPGNVAGSIAFAYPLIDGTRTEAGDARVHFSLRSSW